jgi:serine phosphatase RsbU (regulator of sigma subunit)
MQIASNSLPLAPIIEIESSSMQHTILIVDDDANLTLSIKEKLYNFPEYNFIIEIANDPIEGLELLNILQSEGVIPSLIISDLSMPGMQGDDFLEETMRYFPDSKKILMSGNPNLDAVVHSINSAHIFRMLTKPIQELEFQVTINQAIKAIELDAQVMELNLKLKHINSNLEKIVEEKIYELAEKNQQLTDSIHYAELIQKSVLSSENDFTLEIPNAFTVIFPKDIVSGDFFWYHNDSDYLSYCIADSTGHGVPGAFVSLLAYGALRESFESNKLNHDLNTIICSANNKFKRTLNSNFNKDSAELGYLFFNWKTYELKYLGFKTTLYVIRKSEIIELKGSKLIFGAEHLENIDSVNIQTLQLLKGDTVFMTSDGYIDQFGGKENKKFGSKRFKLLISLIANHSYEKHRKILIKEFLNWKGDNEQTDDVSVFGLTV